MLSLELLLLLLLLLLNHHHIAAADVTRCCWHCQFACRSLLQRADLQALE
jgi:hypothetical protein